MNPGTGPHPEVTQALTIFQAREEMQLLRVLKDHVIQNQADNEEAGEFLKQVKAALNAAEAKRKELVDPMRKTTDWINAQFKPLTDHLKDTEAALKRMIGAYDEHQKANQRALAAAAAELAMATAQTAVTQEEFHQALAMTAQAAPQAVAGVSVRKVWKFEIVDAGRVPRELCSPDPAMIRAAVVGGLREIPGVRVFEDNVVSVRAGGA